MVALGGGPLIQPLPQVVGDIGYGIATAALGLDKLPPADQVKSLLEIPAAELSSKLSKVPFPLSAVVDNDIVKATPTFAGLTNTDNLEALFPGINWCKTISMGDGQLDGMIMAITALGGRTDNLNASLKKCLEIVLADDSSKIPAVLQAYGIDETKDDKMPVIHFINDIIFAQGAKAVAQAWAATGSRLGTKAYLTHFNLPNPWDGPWKGHATHALDTAILLGNYNEYLSEGQKACAEKMTGDFLSLVYGKEPFPAYSGADDGKSMVYFAGADSKEDVSHVVSDSDESNTGRRGFLDDIAAGDAAVLDKLLGAFGLLAQGPK